MTCTTHHICDCLKERMEKLESILAMAKHGLELGYLGCGSTAFMLEEAIAELEQK